MGKYLGNNQFTFENDKERIWSKIEVRGPDDCWEWQAALNAAGYGSVGYGGRITLAHRVVWALEFGHVPEGICVLHTCDNPACCNPEHLWLGTRGDNNRDKKEKGRGAGPTWRVGELVPASKLKKEEVLWIRKLADGGTPKTEIARIFGVGWRHIYKIVNREIWRHI